MPDAADPHPSEDLLSAFDLGRLSPREWKQVERHVSQCAFCCEKLERVKDDSLLLAVRAAGRPATPDTAHASQAPTPSAAPQAPPPAVPPELVGHPRYRVLGFLGGGGMGAVYQAEHRLMDRLVALKVIKSALTAHPGAIERFRLEIKAAARLDHPNIAAAHDAEQAGSLHFLVTEFVEGTTLERRVQLFGPVSPGDAATWVLQAALGLQHAYERGMVHRDIKPGNLMLAKNGRVRVLDFGLARFASEAEADGLTPTGAIVGTPDYIAPEQALDPRRADIRSDIYSLGCTLYFLLTGRAPHPGGTALQKLLAHQDELPRLVTEFRADVPAGLVEVMNRMMAKNPNDRFATPAAAAEALAPFAGALPVAEIATSSVPLPRPKSRQPWLVWAVVVILGLGLMVAGAGSVVLLAYLTEGSHARLPSTESNPGPQGIGPPTTSSPATTAAAPTSRTEELSPKERLRKQAVAWVRDNANLSARDQMASSLDHNIEKQVRPDGNFWFSVDPGLVESRQQTVLMARQGELYVFAFPKQEGDPPIVVGKGGTVFGTLYADPELRKPLAYTLSGLRFYGGDEVDGDRRLRGTAEFASQAGAKDHLVLRLTYYRKGVRITWYDRGPKFAPESGTVTFDFPPIHKTEGMEAFTGQLPIFLDVLSCTGDPTKEVSYRVSNTLVRVATVTKSEKGAP